MMKSEDKYFFLCTLGVSVLFFVCLLIGVRMTKTGEWTRNVNGAKQPVEEMMDTNSGEVGSAQGIEKLDNAESFYYIDKESASGDVKMANEKHADFFVVLEQIESESAQVSIFYNDEYVIPEYDSANFAMDLQEVFARKLPGYVVDLKLENDAILKEAMEPAVYIRGNISKDDVEMCIGEVIKSVEK